jgi:hypothetical protein
MWELSESMNEYNHEKQVAADKVKRAERVLRRQLPANPEFQNEFPTYDIDPIIYRYKIAMVPMKIPDTCLEEVNKNRLKPLRIKQQVSTRVASSLVRNVQKACDKGARIVCCSEYCYPILAHDSLSKRLAELASRYTAYIVAGSYADTESDEPCYAKCMIFSPYRSEPYVQYKMAPGKFGGKREQIETPTYGIIRVFHTQFGNMVILLCIDVQDDRASNGLSVLNEDNIYEPIDLVIVPSYTDDPGTIKRECCSLSVSTGTCTVFVPDWSYGDHCEIYVCGDEQRNDFEQIGRAGQYNGPVHTYSLDLAELRNRRRRELSRIQTKEIPEDNQT